jgi:hypothetical protein
MGATSMALLAFLGAGHTHLKGDYQETVSNGLKFLMLNTSITAEGGDMRGQVVANEGMYVQGLAAIAICEAHALEPKDRRLRTAAELAAKFIISAQDPKGGGWRYQPRQAGDTSVVGWQVMALQSARAAKIPVPPNVFAGVTHFLNTVAVNDGSQYGYSDNQSPGAARTAVGLLCRMYLGWKRNNPALVDGIAYLSKTGPSRGDMYYNYYATQVMHHWGGEEWQKWNAVMRDQLVTTQQKTGHAAGSWAPAGGHGSGQGGRVFQTCLSIMTLEVYYRHLPLYDRKSVLVEF